MVETGQEKENRDADIKSMISSEPICSMCSKGQRQLVQSPFNSKESFCDPCASLIGIAVSKRKPKVLKQPDEMPKKAKKRTTASVIRNPKRQKQVKMPAKSEFTSRRSVTFNDGFLLHPNLRVHVKDSVGDHWPATIVKVEQGKVLLHYYGWSDAFDEWLDSESKRIQVFQQTDVDHSPVAIVNTPAEKPREQSAILESKTDFELITPPSSPIPQNIKSDNPYFEGQTVFVPKDKVYAPGTVIEIQGSNCLVAYIGWRNMEQEWVNFERITLLDNQSSKAKIPAMTGKQQKQQSKKKPLSSTRTAFQEFDERAVYDLFDIHGYYPGRLVNVYDKQGKKWPARMIEFERGKVLIHYDEWDSEFDEWIDSDSKRIESRTEPIAEHEKSEFQFPVLREPTPEKTIEAFKDQSGWFVYCNQCQNLIQTVRVYCSYCEVPTEGYDYESFDLCMNCFECNFPFHKHPRTSFARDYIVSPEASRMDRFDDSIDTRPVNTRCAFCHDSSQEFSPFISNNPFILESKHKGGISKQHYWVHDACARYSPEVYVSLDGKWFNVAKALARGKGITCAECNLPGATIGCFHTSCSRSYHAKCTGKSVEYFASRSLTFCPRHEAIINRMDDYDYQYHCDSCDLDLTNLDWYTCSICAEDYFNTYDLCASCYDQNLPVNHSHSKSDFQSVSWDDRQNERMSEIQKFQKKSKDAAALAGRHLRKLKTTQASCAIKCCFCRFEDPKDYKEWYNGLIICSYCFDLQRMGLQKDEVEALVEMEKSDFSHDHYVTRNSLSLTKNVTSATINSVAPLPDQLYSLRIESSFYDIPTRAPRWAAHLGQDYHGSWLPQIVHWAINKYSLRGYRIFSNFLGRGTDAIECLLLERQCIGIDINPASVKIARNNSAFAIPKNANISAAFRPMIMLGDARKLPGPLFKQEMYDHVLSHPPYKDCIQYSTMIEEDLSRLSDTNVFLMEMDKVIQESWRVLKPGRRVTLAIGDNRKGCYYQPLSFQLFRRYYENGFDLEELIIKRQRHCQGSLMGTYLSNQHDFLMIQHEFITTFRKVANNIKFNDTISILNLKTKKLLLRKQKLLPVDTQSLKGSVWTLAESDNMLLQKAANRFNMGGNSFILFQLENEFVKRVYDSFKKYPLCDDVTGLQGHLPLDRFEFHLNPLASNSEATANVAIIPHVEVPGCSVTMLDWIDDYRSSILEAIRDALAQFQHQSTIIVGVKDFRIAIEPNRIVESEDMVFLMDVLSLNDHQGIEKPTRYVPLSMLVLEDITTAFQEELVIKEFFVVAPSGYQCKSTEPKEKLRCDIESEAKRWKRELLMDENGFQGHRQLLPVVHSNYFIFETKKS